MFNDHSGVKNSLFRCYDYWKRLLDGEMDRKQASRLWNDAKAADYQVLDTLYVNENAFYGPDDRGLNFSSSL